MNRKFGFLGLLFAAALGLFTPNVASAQDHDDYQRGYVQRDNRDQFRNDDRRIGERRDYDREFDRRDDNRRINDNRERDFRPEDFRRPTRTFIQHRGR